MYIVHAQPKSGQSGNRTGGNASTSTSRRGLASRVVERVRNVFNRMRGNSGITRRNRG